ncbi:MAG: Glu/Leu/Phe/Val dehydrogenase family protein [Geminicoccales bacterium]
MGANDPVATDEQVIFFRDGVTGLRGITVLDPSQPELKVGACRRRPYDDEERALADALRQARGTAAKAAAAGLPVGGGCTVLLNDPIANSIPARWHALGRAVDDLKGRYLLMPDPGDTADDMDAVASVTSHVLGTSEDGRHDPAMATALGVLRGIELAVRQKMGRESLSGLRVAIMGLGPSGYHLAEQLRLRGAKIVVADRDPRRTERAVRELGISCVATEEIVHLDADIFAPCSTKDAINDDTLPHLRCSIVAGTADDILSSPAHGRGLHERGILYLPDFVITAGGLISLVDPLVAVGFDPDRVKAGIDLVMSDLAGMIDRAAREGRPTSELAEEFAENRLFGTDDRRAMTDLALAG